MSPWNYGATPNHLVNRAARLLARIGEPRLRELGFGVGQLPVLGALEREGALAQKDLAKRARIEQPTMAEMLARMKRDGLIRFAANPEDKRSKLISLTKLASERLPAVRAGMLRANREAMKGFSEDEVATLVHLLGRMVDNLEAIDAATVP